MAKLWGKSPSEYAGVDQESVEAYLMDMVIGVGMVAEDSRAARERSDDQRYSSKYGKLRTDFDA